MNGGSGPTTDEMKARAEDDDQSVERRVFVEVEETVECVRRVRYEFDLPDRMAVADAAAQVGRGYPPDGAEREVIGDTEQVDVLHRSVMTSGEESHAN